MKGPPKEALTSPGGIFTEHLSATTLTPQRKAASAFAQKTKTRKEVVTGFKPRAMVIALGRQGPPSRVGRVFNPMVATARLSQAAPGQ